jgi:hypothetical protein
MIVRLVSSLDERKIVGSKGLHIVAVYDTPPLMDLPGRDLQKDRFSVS